MRLALVILALLVAGCSSDDSNDPSSSSAPCVVGKLTLIGELEAAERSSAPTFPVRLFKARILEELDRLPAAIAEYEAASGAGGVASILPRAGMALRFEGDPIRPRR